MKRKTTASFRALACAAAVAALSAAVADTIPFWGDETPATNRTAAADVSASPVGGFESRPYVESDFAVPYFSSEKVGMVILVR